MNNLKNIIPAEKLEWLTNQIQITDDMNIDKMNNILKKAVFNNVYTNNIFGDWYIHYFDQKLTGDNDDEKYTNVIIFNETIKSRIKKHLSKFNIKVESKKLVYSTIVINKEENSTTYRIIYLAPDIPCSFLSADKGINNEKILECILKLHLKNYIISNSGYNVVDSFSINEDYYIYCFFKKNNTKAEKGILYCLKPILTVNKGIVSIELVSCAFEAETSQCKTKKNLNKKELLKMQNVPDISFIEDNNAYKIVCFADARKYNLNHILLDFDKFKGTKLGKHIYINELMNTILFNLNIKNKAVTTNPELVFHNLLNVNFHSQKEKIYIAVEESDYHFLCKNSVSISGVLKNEIDLLKETIKKNFPHIDTEIYIFKDTPKLKENELYIAITLKESYKDNYIYNGDNNLLNTSVPKIVLGKKIYTNLDWYTKQKMEIFKNNELGTNKFVTQGLVLRKDLGLFFNDTKEVNKTNLVNKLVYDLLIKKMLYTQKKLNIEDYGFKDIKIFKRFSILSNKSKHVRYGIIHAKIESDCLQIVEAKLISEKEYENISAEYLLENIGEDHIHKSTFVIINGEHIIKIKNNRLNPIPIGQLNMKKHPDNNPLYTNLRSYTREKKDKSGKIITEAGIKTNNLSKSLENNHFVNYNLKTIKKLTGGNNKIDCSYCLLEFKDKDLNYFCIDKNNIEMTVQKINRMECLSLYRLKDFSLNKIKFEENKNILDFYLGLTTDNMININSYSKSTILEKMLNTLWDN